MKHIMSKLSPFKLPEDLEHPVLADFDVQKCCSDMLFQLHGIALAAKGKEVDDLTEIEKLAICHAAHIPCKFAPKEGNMMRMAMVTDCKVAIVKDGEGFHVYWQPNP